MTLFITLTSCGGLTEAEIEALAETGVAQTVSAFSPTPSPPPTSTRTPSPTLTMTPSPTKDPIAEARSVSMTQTTEADVCYRWDQVDDSYMGTRICVYGKIVKLQETGSYAQIVRFSDEAGTFMLWSKWFTYLGLERGRCVAAFGVLTRDGGLFGMEIGMTDLYDYEGCD